MHEFYNVVSSLQPMGKLGEHNVRVMSADASDSIPISRIFDKFLELISLQKNLTHEEQVDHQKTWDKLKSLNEGAFRELQGRYFEQSLQAYLSDPSATGNKQEAVLRIRYAYLTQCNYLTLYGLMLNKLPASFELLTHLETLHLSGNQLKEWPVALEQLTQLQNLRLVGNQLKELPIAVERLTQLRHLSLTGNQLTTLPVTLWQLPWLQNLYLAGNQLTTLPAAVEQLTRLENLYLAENQLTELPSALGRLPRLRNLYLIGNRNLREFPFTLGSFPELIFIDTRDTALNPQLVAAIVQQCRAVRQAHILVDLPRHLQTLKTRENSQVDLSGIERWTNRDKGTLRDWFVHLERTDKPLPQSSAATCEMLSDMTLNEKLKTSVLNNFREFVLEEF